MSLERLVQPELPESHSLYGQFGVVAGWIPGVLTAVENDAVDPEGLGRVRVTCDLMSAVKDMPNDYSGWVWVLTRFVNNSQMGGDHPPLPLGTQVVLLPMLGDPTKLLMLGCVNSRIDRPNPLFNRAEEVTGSQTRGQVFSIQDDPNSEHTTAFPHGVTQQVSRDGDVNMQTQEHARLQLKQDGMSRIENDKGTMFVNPDGEVEHVSAGKAVYRLTKDGEAKIDTPYESRFRLAEGTSHFTGPENELSGRLSKLKQEFGDLGELSSLAGQARQVAQKLVDGGSFDQLSKIADGMLRKFEASLGSLSGAIADIDSLASFDVTQFGGPLLEQANLLESSGIGNHIQLIKETIESGNIAELGGMEIGGVKLSEHLPQQLKQLAHSSDFQLQQVMDDFLLNKGIAGGLSAVENLASMGYHDRLTQLKQIAFSWLDEQRPEDYVDPQVYARLTASDGAWRSHLTDKFFNALPPQVQDTIDRATVRDWINHVQEDDWGEVDLLEHMLGTTSQRAAVRAADALHHVHAPTGFDSGIAEKSSRVPDVTPEVRQQIASQLGKMADMKSALDESTARFNEVVNSVPEGQPGAIVEADNHQASLKSAFGSGRVWADDGGVGATGRNGGFGFGKGGGFMNTVGSLAFKALGKHPAGMLMDPAIGKMALASFQRRRSKNPDVAIEVEKGTASLKAFDDSGTCLHCLRVDRNGIWADNRRIDLGYAGNGDD